MQLRPEQLEQHLGRQLAPVYFISGDDPLRVLEAADSVRAAARQQDYTEREVLSVQAGFDWDSLQSEAGNLSLFATRRLIDLRLPTGKPGDAGSRALRAWAERPPEDTLLLITAGKLDPAARKSKWVKALGQAGVVVFVWPLQVHELPAWVSGRMRRGGLLPTPEAVELLVERVEGNLLACVQEIEKLQLLQGAGPVDAATVTALVADNARFDVFGLVDSALAGDAARGVRILNGLRGEGTVPPVVLWALARELRTLAAVVEAVATGAPLARALAGARVWEQRKRLVGGAVRRLDPAVCSAMLRHCARIDRVCKGQAPGSPWDELLQLILKLSGIDFLPDANRAEPVS
ncbi:MAG: DNA polymerase III subunit delta [Gammaproteobacteria bacterium]|jgi:DNA polymerase-3 subunit delta